VIAATTTTRTPRSLADLTAVQPDEYKNINGAVLVVLKNIDGMRVARNKCDAVASTKLVNNLMDHPDLASFGDSPLQPNPGGTLNDLTAQAAEAKAVMDSAIRDGLANLGVDPDEPIEDPVFRTVFNGAPLKTSESCSRKIANDYKGEFAKVCDIARCTVVVDNEEKLNQFLRAFVSGAIPNIKVVRLKNRFANPMFTGIRDCLMNVEVTCEGESRHVGEVQLHFSDILALKGECHVYYEYFRDFFAGDDASYEMRLKWFDKLNLREGEGVEDAIKRIVDGDDKDPLLALANISEKNVLGDAGLCAVACKRLSAINLREGGESSEDFLVWLCRAGRAYQLKGELDKALEILERSSEGCERALGWEHEITMEAWFYVGHVYDKKGEYGKSLHAYEKCCDGAKPRISRGEYPNYIYNCFNNMGLVYNGLGKIDKALDMFKMSLEGKIKCLGENDPETLNGVSNIAMMLCQQEQFDASLEMYNICLAGRKRVLGVGHPLTLQCFPAMANAH
jgi:tetratricopeptide (TPR) repeat protein